MNDQQRSRADGLTDDQRQALGEAISEYFGRLDSDEGVRAPEGRILRAFDYCDSRNIDDLIDRAVVPALAASPVEQHAAAPTGYCERAGNCVCGGDLPRVREGCSEWVKVESQAARATSANETGAEGSADEPYQVTIDVRDLFAYLRAAWREGQHYDREDFPDQADSWSAASDYAIKTIERWTSMNPAMAAAAPADERAAWDRTRHALAVAMVGFASRTGSRNLDAAVHVLDALTEPGSPLAWLCTARAVASPAAEPVRTDVTYDDVVSACDAHGIALPVEAIDAAVALINHFAAPQPAQADAPADARPKCHGCPINPTCPSTSCGAPADAGEPIGQHDLSTSTGGRAYIAEFFAKRLRRHDFGSYIAEWLAADFACALAQYLSEHDAASRAEPRAELPRFPTMLRKMWSGGEVQRWIDENVAPRAPLTNAVRDVLAERRRHVEQEGWTPEHDDQHTDGAMARAAACYAYPELTAIAGLRTWPWDTTWWKPSAPRRNLVKAVALGIAEIERLDRAAARAGESQ
ncbi:hypothetical protein WT81_05020 [Burkholderia stagnalis]|uniref:hypothetical protein n=1 Tax=Burkholderia stagnalis TaxID=1503054 RepID=UPI00075FD63E|nr:hypothetical protein [Burkholderia stagnalis]KWK48040.1 hypothetical protein WT80_18670 [Burkholderia stagnalis]KWK66639.1 hypothetical protein WT81_05020 [Burkholderia stagnalis]